MNSTGKIGVTSENIFPIIKKFLYSEHDIFLRELVSNAVDATTKLQTIAKNNSDLTDLGNLNVEIVVDKEAKTLSIKDRGIGMTQEEIERYINQIAFSGAEEFLKKYEGENATIIGHFGLGFYSAFMVAKSVEIDTLSYQKDAQPIHWSCDGSPEYTLTPSERTERGTTITLHIDDESLKFLEKEEINKLLNKYCRFLPIPIIFGKKEEWKEGKMQPTDEDNQVNETHPLWIKNPSDLSKDEYLSFYHSLYPMSDDPLFWIHLNVDYPFTLKGVLYFPKIKPNVELRKNRINLYCNQVFVTDHVEDIVPEWLTLLEGIIDSPDIPLNVSRSYLQNDANAQKIAKHISKKVSDKLAELFQNNRKEYEEKWSSIGLFVHYGMLTDDKTYERLLPSLLFTDTDKKHYTLEEYRTLVESNQTNKEGNWIILYATHEQEQYLPIQNAIAKGYNVLLMEESPLSLPMINMLEQKLEKVHFVRVDSDTVENLITKEHTLLDLSKEDEEILQKLFSLAAPSAQEKHTYHVQVDTHEITSPEQAPIELIQNEWMRRMKDLSRFQQGMDFYGALPDSFNLVVYAHHPIIKEMLNTVKKENGSALNLIQEKQKELEQKRASIINEIGDKKEDELDEALRKQRAEVTEDLEKKKQELDNILGNSSEKSRIDQLWDLALLSRNLLNGKRLQDFITRSCQLLNP